MNKSILTVQNLWKSFGDNEVHRGIHFDLNEGELLGLVGASGSGKSLILRAIIGLDRVDAGAIYFDNQDLTHLRERDFYSVRTRISYVFQNGALFDSLTVEDNLAYPLREHTDLTEEKILERVNETLALLDLKGTNHHLPAELSGGMQKRVGLARATILEPQVILYDEPTAGLDPTNTKRLLKNMLKLKEKGITGTFVTHDIESAFYVCDRIAFLHNGQIRLIDTVANMKQSEDLVLKQFFGEEQ